MSQQQAGNYTRYGSNKQLSIRDETATNRQLYEMLQQQAGIYLYEMRQEQAGSYTRYGSSRQLSIRDETATDSYLYEMRQQ